MSEPLPANLRMDGYTRVRYRAWVPQEQQDAIEAAIPVGYAMHVTHGGNQYTARLFREDGEAVTAYRASRIETACERVLAECVWVQTA